MGGSFDHDADMEIVRADLIQKTDEYYLPRLAKVESSIVAGHAEWKHAEWQAEAQRYRDKMQEPRNGSITKYDSYESVKIYFEKKPSAEIIEFMKKRAQEFSETHQNHQIKILGFRLEESATKTSILSV